MAHRPMRISREMLDVLIRAGLVVVLVIFCYRVFRPFLDLMLWATILAITLYPLYLRLAAKLGGRNKTAATLIVLIGIVVLVVPVYVIAVSTYDSLHELVDAIRNGRIHVPPPSPKVAEIPLIGAALHKYWSGAATDLTAMLQPLVPQIRAGGLALVGKLAGLGGALLLFLGALIIAGIIFVYGAQGHRAAIRIANRFFGDDRGAEIEHLCTQTVRTVAQGVVGIAFIQMLLIAIGFVIKGVPGAGLLSIVVLLLGVAQIPATLITVPVIALVFWREGANAGTIAFGIYTFIAGLADNVLKPLLLGRGVDVPMPVILIGALGGMVSNGVIGLFIGPVALAVAYHLFWQWVDRDDGDMPGLASVAAAMSTATAKPPADPPP